MAAGSEVIGDGRAGPSSRSAEGEEVDLGERGEVSGEVGRPRRHGGRLIPSRRRRRRGGPRQPAPVATRSPEQGRRAQPGGSVGLAGWVASWAEAQGERGFNFLFLFLLSFIFQQLLPFSLITIDFAKICHWPKQFHRIIVHGHKKKIMRLLR